MTESEPTPTTPATTPEPAIPPGAVPVVPASDPRPNRLYQTAAWVAIVAGIVFIVGAVFFTGFALGRHSGDGPRHHGGSMFVPRPGMDRDGQGPMGPGMMGPGMMGPGMMGPGMMGPGMMDPDDGPGMRPQGGPSSPSAGPGPAPRP